MANPYPYGECTWWVWSQVYEYTQTQLPAWGNAEDWLGNARSAGYSTGSIYDAKPGDILCWGHRYNPDTVGHVQYVVSDNGDTLRVSESWHDLSNPPNYVNISKSSPTYGQGDGFPFQGVILIGGGGGGDPDDPPPPQPGGHWEWVEETVTTTEYYSLPYTDIYECGVGLFSDQSGTQDEPLAPTSISQSTSRLNQRWEPFNMYTYERVLTYNANKSPKWSGWVLAYHGSDNIMLGNQPSYGNGWQIDWE